MSKLRPRLTAVLTHPVQYYAAWFRYMTRHCAEIELTVLYGIQPTPHQQGVGFGCEFTWDVPLTEGYSFRVARAATPGDNVQSDSFWGLNVRTIGAALLETKPDAALIFGWYSITLVRALMACNRHGIPAVYRGDTHSTSYDDPLRRGLWKTKTRWLLGRFSACLSAGRKTREHLRQFVPETKIYNSPHCVDNDFFAESARPYCSSPGRAEARAAWGLSENDFVVLFVGKLSAIKRPLDLIQAASRLRQGTRLLMVGSGELEDACRQEAQRRGIGISWAGFLNQSEMGKAFGTADCLVLPSENETWGLVVNEAMAAGVPCVVSDHVGCAPDLIIPGQTGEVFRRGEIEDLVSAIERVRQRKSTGHDYSAACKTHIKGYSYEAATRGLVSACKDLAG